MDYNNEPRAPKVYTMEDNVKSILFKVRDLEKMISEIARKLETL